MRAFRGGLASLAVALVLVGISGVPAAAQERPVLIARVTDSPDPAPSATKVVYAIFVKNDGISKARNVVVTIEIPANTSVDKCNILLDPPTTPPSTACPPVPAPPGTVIVNLGEPDPSRPGSWFIKAHREPRINLTLNMPAVSAVSTVTVSAKANGDNVTDSDQVAQTTTVLPPTSVPVTFLPSGRSGSIACGLTLTPDFFQSDTTVKLLGGLGCTSEPYGLKITTSGKTLDLNTFKILGVATLGNVGILVSNASDVTINGGSKSGSSGIETFDWCVKDEGDSNRLTITALRCFRARTAGIDITSKKASIVDVLVDRAVGTATTTAELPGGVGIRLRGDKASIKNSIVRQTGTIGIWVAGTDSNGDGRVASITGSNMASSTSKMRIEDSTGIGLLLEGGPHFVKDLYVDGLYNDRDEPPVEGKNGVVVGPTGLNSLLDGVVVKQHGGHAFVVEGAGTTITNSNVDGVGLDGFVVSGPGSTLSGNGVQNARNGFIVTATGFDTDLDTNETEELDGDGFVVDGDSAVLSSNSAQGNHGRGFVIGGDSGFLDTNTAEDNDLAGFIITGNNNTFRNNNAEGNGGIGFDVSGTGNDFNTNSASNNDGQWEWKIGAGQTQVGGKTNKVSGKTFCIPPAGGNFETAPNTGICP